MRHTTTRFLAIGFACCALLIAYFHPMSLNDKISEQAQIHLVCHAFDVRDGQAVIHSDSLSVLTDEEKRVLLDCLAGYPYRRTPGTLFSDGSIVGLGNRALSIDLYDGTALTSHIYIASSGKVAVNGKTYRMQHAEQLIAQIMALL